MHLIHISCMKSFSCHVIISSTYLLFSSPAKQLSGMYIAVDSFLNPGVFVVIAKLP